ncbi:MAG: helix-turn-helix transcriptional regulator [Rubrobacteraceae bacterium]
MVGDVDHLAGAGKVDVEDRELADRSGVNYNAIWRIEVGRTGAQPRTVRRLAEALGVEPYELMKEGDDG